MGFSQYNLTNSAEAQIKYLNQFLLAFLMRKENPDIPPKPLEAKKSRR